MRKHVFKRFCCLIYSRCLRFDYHFCRYSCLPCPSTMQIVGAVVFNFGLHQVPEGYVGMYWRAGALLDTITEPGMHFYFPLLTTYENIQVTLQTDKVTNIPCGTKGGVLLHFEKVEVVNRLAKAKAYDTVKEYGIHYDKIWIYDKIHHEINQFCSVHTLQEVYIDYFDQVDERLREALQRDLDVWAPGIAVVSVRVTKPRIPDQISRNYEAMENERQKAKIALERHRVVEMEAQTERQKAVMEAQKHADTSAILLKTKLMEVEARQKEAFVEDEIMLSRQKAVADAEAYRVTKEAEANRLKLTKEFLELKFIEAISGNTKIFFGEKIPSVLLDQRLAGSVLDKLKAATGEESV
eukprot:jgi/Mesvir1/4326/Mv25948-RA.1